MGKDKQKGHGLERWKERKGQSKTAINRGSHSIKRDFIPLSGVYCSMSGSSESRQPMSHWPITVTAVRENWTGPQRFSPERKTI